MRLSILFTSLLVGGAFAVPNAQPNDAAEGHNFCGNYKKAGAPNAGRIALDGNGACVIVKDVIADYIVKDGCICDFYSSAGCDKNAHLGSLVREVKGRATGDLPNSVKWWSRSQHLLSLSRTMVGTRKHKN
ncbi:hypothetical protein K491DRAFT_677895 [Lophiostoma macrostomum CBS 122681]|uniref:Uncharacterized protein n=1 Tax=Lophiostoma macrostomum CBS 122681 TaxID=1314788 RepID=A0A6A6TCH8_9PLEO|nr:hypothetical protein K491DRAFT_677895 [Lophiostoma macrostomum CBS 122681]